MYYFNHAHPKDTEGDVFTTVCRSVTEGVSVTHYRGRRSLQSPPQGSKDLSVQGPHPLYSHHHTGHDLTVQGPVFLRMTENNVQWSLIDTGQAEDYWKIVSSYSNLSKKINEIGLILAIVYWRTFNTYLGTQKVSYLEN